MRPQHRAGTRAAALLAGAVLLAGCGTGGELKSAGRAPTAIGPARLWPELPPPPPPRTTTARARPRTSPASRFRAATCTGWTRWRWCRRD